MGAWFFLLIFSVFFLIFFPFPGLGDLLASPLCGGGTEPCHRGTGGVPVGPQITGALRAGAWACQLSRRNDLALLHPAVMKRRAERRQPKVVAAAVLLMITAVNTCIGEVDRDCLIARPAGS